MSDIPYAKLRAIDVSSKIEKKNGLSYLSWPFAVDQLLLQDPAAEWTYTAPVSYGDTLMVFCTVTAFGKARTAQLPVMDHRNKAIPNPDSFAVNTAMQRCLVKAIALHGIGLYIYAGEDLPGGPTEAPHEEMARRFREALAGDYQGATEEAQEAERAKAIYAVHHMMAGDEELYRAAWKLLESRDRSAIKTYIAMVEKK